MRLPCGITPLEQNQRHKEKAGIPAIQSKQQLGTFAVEALVIPMLCGFLHRFI
jgi:hypothetical protein